MKKSLSVVIPAKNEEKRISKTLKDYGKYFHALKGDLETEVLVVVNDTNDKTISVVNKYRNLYPQIKVIETKYSTGKGGAVALGFKESKGDYIGYVDADSSTSAKEFYRLYAILRDTPDLDGVIGSRHLKTSKVLNKFSLHRRLLSRVYNLAVGVIFNLSYKDTQCGVKIFKKSVAKSISTKLSNTGWTFDVNVLLVCKYFNYKIQEIATEWIERSGSSKHLVSAFFNVLNEIYTLKCLELNRYFSKPTQETSGLSQKVKKRVLILAWRDIKHPEAGGSEVYVHNVAKRLAKTCKVTLFTSKPSNLSENDIIDGIDIIRKGGVFSVYFWALIFYFLKFRKNVDFIIDVQNGIPFFTPLYSNKQKLMLVHHIHGSQWFSQFPVLVALTGYFIETIVMPLTYKDTQIVTVSHSSMRSLRKIGFKDRNIFLGFNALPHEHHVKNGKSKDPLIVYVGRIKKYKRLEIAINTVRNLSLEYKNLKMIIAGVGDHEDKLKELVRKYKLEKVVEFRGFVSEAEKHTLMRKAWVFVMPSMKEGWGITIIEANHNGTPAVGFDVDGVRDSISPSFTGYLAHSNEDLVRSVDLILSNPRLRKTFDANCRSWAGRFSWNQTTKVFEGLIKSNSNPGLVGNKVYPWSFKTSYYFL